MKIYSQFQEYVLFSVSDDDAWNLKNYCLIVENNFMSLKLQNGRDFFLFIIWNEKKVESSELENER